MKIRQIPQKVKQRILEKKAQKAYESGDFATFAATYDYFGYNDGDKYALEIGRADPEYWEKYSEIEKRYSGNVDLTGAVKFKPFWFGSYR